MYYQGFVQACYGTIYCCATITVLPRLLLWNDCSDPFLLRTIDVLALYDGHSTACTIDILALNDRHSCPEPWTLLLYMIDILALYDGHSTAHTTDILALHDGHSCSAR